MAAPIHIIGIKSSDNCNTVLEANSIINQAICSCGGRLIRPSDTANNISVSGSNWVIQASAYFGIIYQQQITTPITYIDKIVDVVIDSTVQIPVVSGNGTLIIRIPKTYTNVGGNIGDGYIFTTTPSAFQFLPNIFTCQDIKNSIAGDGFVIVGSVVGGVLQQAPLAELCMPINCDVMEECIDAKISDIISQVPGVIPALSVFDNDGCAPHYLSWVGTLTAASPAGSQYRVFRNGVQIATYTHTTTTHTDYTPTAGTTNTYRIDQYDAGTGVISQSNNIIMAATSCFNLRCGDFGNGSNGILDATTTISRANVMQYSSVNLGAGDVITVNGTGPAIWLVNGNFTMTSTSIINSTAVAPVADAYSSIVIHGLTPPTNTFTTGPFGNGGTGGNGSPSGIGGAGGSGAVFTSTTNSASFGGLVPPWTNTFGEPGHTSSTIRTYGPGGGGGGGADGIATGGNGGIGGVVGNVQYPLIIVVRGNISITGGTINGAGGNGGAGGIGGAGGYNAFGIRRGGGGGGGGGGAGAGGINTYIYHLGTQSGTPAYNAAFGSGGAAGVGGSLGGLPGIPQAGTGGFPGGNGVAGTFSKIQLTC